MYVGNFLSLMLIDLICQTKSLMFVLKLADIIFYYLILVYVQIRMLRIGNEVLQQCLEGKLFQRTFYIRETNN